MTNTPPPLSDLLARAEELSTQEVGETLADWRALGDQINMAITALPRVRDDQTEETLRALITLLERVIDRSSGI